MNTLSRAEWVVVADQRLEDAARHFRRLEEMFYPTGKPPQNPSQGKAVNVADEAIVHLRATIEALERMKETQ